MTARALPGNMNRNSPGTHRGNQWVYFAPHSPELMDTDGYFLPIHNHVGRTDVITAYAEQPDGSWFQAQFVVLHSEPKCVITQRLGEWEHFTLAVMGVDLINRGNERYDVVETSTGRTLRKDADVTTANALAQAYRREGTRQASRAEMQAELKRLTGKGLPPTTPTDEIEAALAAAMKDKAA